MIKQSKNGILEEPSILGRSWCTNIGHLLKFTLKLLAHRPWISDEYLNVHVWYLCCECCFSIRYALTSVHRQPQVWVGNLHMWWKWPKPQEISLWGAKNHAEINTHSANANLTGVVEWRNAIWLPVRNIFRGNVGLTGCFVYIAVPGDRWGTEGRVGSPGSAPVHFYSAFPQGFPQSWLWVYKPTLLALEVRLESRHNYLNEPF